MLITSSTLGWLAELGLCLLGLFAICRIPRERLLLPLTLGSFTVRILAGEGLYLISLFQLPILRQLQMPNGFWLFGFDASIADEQARTILSLAGNSRLATIRGSLFMSLPSEGHVPLLPFSRVLAAIYALFGPHPSQGLLFVAVAATACCPLVYITAQQLHYPRLVALASATVVAYWPSTFLWSALNLKDSLQWLAMFVVAAGAATILGKTRPIFSRGSILPALAVVVGTAISASLRLYTAPAWIVAGFLGLATWLVQRRPRTIFPLATAGVLALGIVVVNTATEGAISDSAKSAALSLPGATNAASRLMIFTAKLRGQPVQDWIIPAQPGEALFDTSLGVFTVRQMRNALAVSPTMPNGERNLYQATAAGMTEKEVQIAFGKFTGGSVDPHTSYGSQCPPAAPLLVARRGFTNVQAGSQVDGDLAFGNCQQVLAYMPRALEQVFLAPLPNEWLDQRARTGQLAYVAIFDVMFVWLLLPGLVIAAVRTIRRPEPGSVMLLTYVLTLALALGFVVSVAGALIRLRLQVLLPAAILSIDGWLWLWQRVDREWTSRLEASRNLVLKAIRFPVPGDRPIV